MVFLDYHRVIKNPMDLGTVRQNVQNNVYKVPHEFCIDMRLIFQNSRLYNTNKRSRVSCGLSCINSIIADCSLGLQKRQHE